MRERTPARGTVEVLLDADGEVNIDFCGPPAPDVDRVRILSLVIRPNELLYSQWWDGMPTHGRVALTGSLPQAVMTALQYFARQAEE